MNDAMADLATTIMPPARTTPMRCSYHARIAWLIAKCLSELRTSWSLRRVGKCCVCADYYYEKKALSGVDLTPFIKNW